MRKQASPRGGLDSRLRLISPVLFVLTGLLFWTLPVAGSFCGDEEALVEVCVSGAQLLTGDPVVATHGSDPDMEPVVTAVFADAARLPGWLTALAVGFLVVLLVGAVLALAVYDMRRRAIASLAAAAVGVVLLAFTASLALNELHASLELVRAVYSGTIDADPRTGHATMAAVAWVALIPLGAVIVVEAVAVRRAGPR
jgi:hypothetical protein